MYKYTKNLLPSSFNNTFKKLGNFERSLNYQIDILNTGSLEYLPSCALLKIWNKLPLNLKRSASLGVFKKKVYLKYYLTPTFQSAINPFVILAKNEYRTL